MDHALRKIIGVPQPSDDWEIHDYLREERELTEVLLIFAHNIYKYKHMLYNKP
jgi:hypothetical protein